MSPELLKRVESFLREAAALCAYSEPDEDIVRAHRNDAAALLVDLKEAGVI